jgi:hypothetical protein
MKWLKSGPELKMPDLGSLRVPAFLEDLYYDLKDRRLLPLVALAIVAIVAVPVLLSGGADHAEPPAAADGGGSASASASGAEASLTVVRATPGLRDYRKRLRDRSPTDPFKQHFTAPDLTGAQLGSPGDSGFEAPAPTSTSTTSSSSPSTTIESTATSEKTTTTQSENGVVETETETKGIPGPQGTGNSASEGNSGAAGDESRWIAFAVDVRIKTAVTLPDGTVESGEPVTMTKVRAPASIPTERTPVITYLGANLKTGKIVLLISDEVTSVFGEGNCLSGTQACQLLEVETGMPTTFVYGPAGERYKITFTKIERVDVELPKNLERSAESP